MAKTLKVRFLDEQSKLISEYDTGETDRSENQSLEDWYNDNNVEHPGEPADGYDQFEIVYS